MVARISLGAALFTLAGACGGEPAVSGVGGGPGPVDAGGAGGSLAAAGGAEVGLGGATGTGASAGTGAGSSGGGAPAGLKVGYDGVQAYDAEVGTNSAGQARIRAARVFLGHQSIGANTLEGMASLGFAGPWVFWDFPETADYNGGAYLGQKYIGQNGDPKGKASAFRSFMIDGGFGARVDVAGMKVCFVDFDDDGAGPAVGDAAEIAALEQAYAAAIADVRAQYPQVRLFHVTPPLVAADYWSVGRNALRVEVGDWLEATYGATDAIFDLQDVESLDPATGQRCTAAGQWALCDANAADDRAHLSPAGSERVAKAFLVMLARLTAQ